MEAPLEFQSGAMAADSGEVIKDKQEQEVIVDVSSSKAKDSGDVALQPLGIMKGEAANVVIPVESECRTNSNKLSKRKRKNRKRRIKNAVALSFDNSVNEGDSIIESTRASEDGKGEETDTDVEAETGEGRGLDDGFEYYLTVSEVPSITITTVEGKSSTATDIGTSTTPVMKNAQTFTQENQRYSSGPLLEEPFVNMHKGYPTHSVSTLLQLAKQRVSNGVLHSSIDSFLEGQYDFQSDSSSMFTVSEEIENEESEPNFTVPPCSPSSIHNIVTVEESEVVLPIPKQKSVTRTVHFDERPPEVMEAPSDFTPQSLSNLSSVEKLQAAVNELHQARLRGGIDPSLTPSKETVILVHNVNSTSATSSIGSSSIVSLESAVSLLKGGSSCEDFVESSIHLPSREALSVEEAVITHNHSEICMNSCSLEEVEKFKIYCPDETMQLNADLNSVFMEAVDMLPEVSYINEYRYSRCADGSEQTVVSSQKCQQNEQGTVSLAFGNPEVIFSIETNECDDSVVDSFLTTSQDNNTGVLKLDANGNPIEAPGELIHQEVSLDVISETETDEIETFSRDSSLPACAQESQIDFEESMMSEEHGSNETIVQANEGISKVISVVTSIVDNANVASGSLEEIPYSDLKSKEQTEMETLNNQNAQPSRYPTFYETDESEFELAESVNSVLFKSTTEQSEVGSSEIPTIENSTSRQSESEYIILDIDLTKSQEPHASGDIPIQLSLPDNNNLDGSDTESERNGPNNYTDTESDFPFLPERTESLAKAIESKAKSKTSSKSKPSSNAAGTDENVEPEELEKQGCSCAKLCVIM